MTTNRWTAAAEWAPGRRCAGLILILAIGGAAPPARAGSPPVGRLIIFGDSLSDTGNVDDLTFGIVPGSPYWQGRFSNGPVWVEQLAVELAVGPPVPSRNGGTNYAHGGAETGPGNSQIFIPNVGPQIGSYVASGPAVLPDDLFVVWAGGNDFLNGESDTTVPVTNLRNHIIDLAAAGAERFLVVDMPPLGQTPGSLGTPDEIVLDALSAQFNDQYSTALNGLVQTLGVTIHRLDVFGLFQQLLASPGDFGLTNVTDPAYDEATGMIVPNPDEYAFWDDIHPTTVAHALLGERAAARITCPADIDGDGQIGGSDLVRVILDWGATGFSLSDTDDNGVVDGNDVVAVILAWGGCP